MFPIVTSALWVFAAWRFGDWKHWSKYHATVWYWIGCDLLAGLFTRDYRLWWYTDAVLPAIVDNLLQMFIIYPSAMLIYQYHFPKRRVYQGFYILIWVSWWSLVELYLVYKGRFQYGHGWTFWWSVLFNVISFLMLRLHYRRPLTAYAFSVPISIGLFWYFKVPFTSK